MIGGWGRDHPHQRARQKLPIGPGSVVVVLGNFTQESSGVLQVQVSSNGIAGTLHVNGCATLDGTLSLTFTSPHPPTNDEKVCLCLCLPPGVVSRLL